MLCSKHSLNASAIICCILYVNVFCIKFSHQDDIETILEWKRLQFDYPNEAARQRDITEGIYKPDVPIPMDVDAFYARHNKRFIFVTIPKLRPGVPVTFGYVSDKKYDGDPVITPFPNWDWHRNTSQCTNKFVSVYSVHIDKCGYLHILDSGNEGNGVICPPKVVMFNLNHFPWSSYVQNYYEYPSTVYKSNSLFTSLQIQSNTINCIAPIFTLIADTAQSSMVHARVHPAIKSNDIKVKHESMKPVNGYTDFEILGTKFTLNIGILATSLSSPMTPIDIYRTYAYMPLSSGYFSHINTQHFYSNEIPIQFQTFKSPTVSQTAAMVSNRQSIMFLSNMQNTSIVCFHPYSTDFGPNVHTVYKNTTTLQFVSGMKIVETELGHEQLWIMSNRLQKALTTGYDFNEVNFRISVGWTKQLLNDSPCQSPAQVE